MSKVKNKPKKEYISSEGLTPVQEAILRLLYINGSLPRSELVKRMKRARTTIYDNLIKLEKKKLVDKFSSNNGQRGRPLIYWQITH